MKSCVCCSGKPYRKCCGRFLDDGEYTKTPEQLMRSRFSAYKLGGYGQYLVDTWYPATLGDVSAAELSVRQYDWQHLDVLDKSQKGDEGLVEFKAWFREKNAEELDCLHEKSVFQRLRGRWYYVGAQVQ